MARRLLDLPSMRIALALLLAAAGCGQTASTADDDGSQTDGPDAAPPATGLARCVGRRFEPPAAVGWEHLSNDVAAASGSPRHYTQDVIAAPGDAPHIDAKLAYSASWNDLEDEPVEVFVDDCETWRDLGTVRTDTTGHAQIDLPADLAIGVHEVRVVALGDASQAVSTAWVLPRGTHVVVSDVDGTLTTSDSELFQEILDGSYVPEAYPGAQALTAAHESIDHVVVYLTGRPYWLLDITRGWLAERGFAAGPLHVADSNGDILPTDDSVGAYKLAWLDGLEQAGYVIDAAYGNATTDVYGYLGAGLAPDDVWIIGDNAGAQGTHAVTDSWEPRAAEVAALPAVDQPF